MTRVAVNSEETVEAAARGVTSSPGIYVCSWTWKFPARPPMRF